MYVTFHDDSGAQVDGKTKWFISDNQVVIKCGGYFQLLFSLDWVRFWGGPRGYGPLKTRHLGILF
jgi:hypothetical protein